MVLAATPAGACVTSADMAEGVVATFDNGLELVLRRASEDEVHVDEVLAPGEMPYRTVRRLGFWETEAYDLDPQGHPVRETGIEWLYEDVDALPPIQQDLVWSGWSTAVVGGMVRRSDNLLVSVKFMVSVTVGDCIYDALVVQTLIDQATEMPLIRRELFLPGLGAALPWIRAGEDEARTEITLMGLEPVGR
jgi:hypothetical protein